MDIFNVRTDRDIHFQMRKKGFLLGVGVVPVKGKTYQQRSFLMIRVQVKMRIPLVHPSKMEGGKRRTMKMLL